MIDRPSNDAPLSDLANAAFSAAAEDILEKARQAGTEIVLWQNNAVLRVSPAEFEREKNGGGQPESS